MTRPLPHVLTWSEVDQHYELQIHGQPEQYFRLEDEPAFSRWLAEHTALAFVGQAGQLSVLKETRQRGKGYWYAYRTQRRHTRKRYLGPTDKVSLVRLEKIAKALDNESSRVPLTPEPSLLLSSKLTTPRLPRFLVARSRLLKELDSAYSHKLMLISASAGSGKTTLLSTWMTASSSSKTQNTIDPDVLVWLSLDSLDNTPTHFWSSVITALRTSLPRIGQTALTLLHSQEAPSLTVILTNLLSEIEQIKSEIILILDDYHVIKEQAIHEGTLFLLNHMPEHMHLVISTRTDPTLPLSPLRIHGQLIEIRDPDLRFTHDEAATFLVQNMSLPLSPEDVTILHQRTEGWIAGMHLAALSMHKRENLEAFVKGFAGNHRFMLDFVQQDILVHLPDSLQHFLLQTSIVSNMNAALCQAITQLSSREKCQLMLEELERANLFIVPLDEQKQWYRYHDLFRQALQTHLQASFPHILPLLHVRAARFYEAAGEIREAITHALAAPDYSLAASLIEQAAPEFWMNGETRTITTWVLSLPDFVLYTHSRLALHAALRSLNASYLSTEPEQTSGLSQVLQIIKRLETLLQDHKKPELDVAEQTVITRRIRLLHAFIKARSLLKSDDDGSLLLLAQETEALPPDEEGVWNMIPFSFTWWLLFMIKGQGTLLIERLIAMKRQAIQQGNHLEAIQLTTRLALVYEQAGQLYRTQQECLGALPLVMQIGERTALAGYLYLSLFQVYYYWNRLEEASEVLQRLLGIGHDWQHIDLLTLGRRAQLWLELARGNLSAAGEALQKLEDLVTQERFANYISMLAIERVHYWLALGKLDEAFKWAEQTTISSQTVKSLQTFEVLAVVRVYLAQQQYSQALSILERFRTSLDLPEDIKTTIPFLGLQMVLQHLTGNPEQTNAVAARLLSITEPENNIRTYLDMGEPMKEALKAYLVACASEEQNYSSSFAAKVLHAFEQQKLLQRDIKNSQAQLFSSPNSSPGSSISLSRQEHRVLHLLVAGHTYIEIAKELVVSPNTVKTQVSSIYRKLGVSRRAEAIRQAHQQHLLIK